MKFRNFFGKILETANVNKNGYSANGYRYSFGQFTIDRANRIVVRDGETVALTAKVFDILAVLAENPGRLLEKDELIERVWPGTYIEEGNLARNVSTLRRALGDDSKPHKFIETVPGRGYRFVAEVAYVADIPEPQDREQVASSRDISPASPDRLRSDISSSGTGTRSAWRAYLFSRPRFLSLAVLCIAVAAIIAFRSEGDRLRQIDLVSYDRAKRSKLTQEGNVYGGFISPDGLYLAFTRLASKDERALSLRQIATGSVVDLRPPSRDVVYWAVAFSHDSSFLYYIAREGGSDFGKIYRIPLLGGTPRPLVTHANGGLAISPDGRRLAFVRIDREKGVASIVVADADGSNEREIISCDGDSGYYSLDWSPDGGSLMYAFRRHGNDHDQWYLAEIPAAGGTERILGDVSDTPVFGAKWLPDKSGLIVNAVDEGTRQPQIYSVSYPDGARRRITNDLNSYVGFSMTADARMMVLPQTNSNRQIWEITDGKASTPTQLTFGNETHYESVSWIGNDYIVFDQDENSSYDNYNIWRMRPDGSDRVQLTYGSDDNTQPSVSPDGTTIVFVSRRSGKRQLWRMNADGSDLRQLTEFPNGIFNPRFSNDGRWVYFGTSEAGVSRVRRVSAGGGEAELVIDPPTQVWDLSPDASRIAFLTLDRSSGTEHTWVRPIAGAATADTALAFKPETWMRWSRDGKSLYYNSGKDGSQNVWMARFDGTAPRQVTDFKDEKVFACSWSSDGTRSACIRQANSFDAVLLRFE